MVEGLGLGVWIVVKALASTLGSSRTNIMSHEAYGLGPVLQDTRTRV